MPLAKRWSAFNKEDIKNFESDNFGIYEIGHSATAEVLYIG